MPGRDPMPQWVDPELATLTRDRFSDPAWIYERKLDGERCLAFRDGSGLRLMTRNAKPVATTYPEVAGALAAQDAAEFIIDGEVVAFADGQTRFAQLQQRMQVAQPPAELLRAVPVQYYIFDVMYAGGTDLRSQPQLERKERLRGIVCRAAQVTDEMILAAAKAVADEADVSAPGAALLPTNAALRTTSSVVALQVAKAAQEQGVVQAKLDDPVEAVRQAQWWPEYCPVVAV